jgi:hydroxymethylbilane synthase
VAPLRLRAATRGSALARWQTDHVASALRAAGRAQGIDIEVESVIVETDADRRQDVPIWEVGGKGVFVKQVQAAVLDRRADFAVHSGKDLPSMELDGLTLAAVPERADARDVLVGSTLTDLAPGATIATGSVRRRAQLAWTRPDLTFIGLRGNIATRLTRVPEHGAIVMAQAALQRLDIALDGLAFEVFDPSVMLPQVAQGALAVECRADDAPVAELLAAIEHGPTRCAVDAERAFLAELGGDCDLPAGAHATIEGDTVRIEGLVASLDGHVLVRAIREGDDGPALGRALARHLLDDAGGAALLDR